MRRRTTILLITSLVALAGCGNSSGEPDTIRVTVTQTVTAQPSSKPAAAPDDGIYKMGDKATINDTESNIRFTAQVVEYQQPYKGPQPQKPSDFQGGDTWATASIKVCNEEGETFSVDQSVWSLEYADGISVESTGLSGGDMPKPEYPMDKAVKAGRCAAGLIAYPVDGSKRPERVVYSPEGLDSREWAISEAD
ncbi:DUF4352 domain-containing protein [Streptomyces sp. NPDC021969]|uniref:DUF4352 domain-containing protein n=1 Tax=unclassified Streptomyces TaxID=2593676 RepID=UPI0033EBF9B2